MKNNCDFCEEINGTGVGTFYDIYNNIIKSRIIYEDSNFVVIPTMGQLFIHSLLILPKEHFESLSELGSSKLKLLNELFYKVKKKLTEFGYVVAFEHGAKSFTNGGCGIYHAHLHIVPLPIEISMFDFLKHEYVCCTDLVEGLEKIGKATEYLMAINHDNSCSVLDISKYPKEYPSQFFRKELSSYFNLKSSWNWKEYGSEEQWLLESVNKLNLVI